MNRNQQVHRPKVTGVCTDEIQILALTVTRFIAAGYMTQDVACWDAGHQRAEEALGYVNGPRLIAAMTGIMRALRAERQQPWQFMPATCCRVTSDEVSLINALAQAGGADPAPFAPVFQTLTGQNEAPRLAHALKVAAQALEDFKPALASSRSRQVMTAIVH
jgi:hypothetical protein